MDTVIDIFYNQLELSCEQQFDVCKAFYILKRPVNFFVGNEKLQPFTRIKDTSERIKLYKKALNILAKIPPADAVSAFSVRRKQQLQKTVKFTNQVYSPNDVPIENSLIYSLFTSTVGPVSDENEAVTILLPSVFFARKWLSDRLLTKQKMCFVFENSAVLQAQTMRRASSAQTQELLQASLPSTKRKSGIPSMGISQIIILDYFTDKL